jgi:hypothetical protein
MSRTAEIALLKSRLASAMLEGVERRADGVFAGNVSEAVGHKPEHRDQ